MQPHSLPILLPEVGLSGIRLRSFHVGSSSQAGQKEFSHPSLVGHSCHLPEGLLGSKYNGSPPDSTDAVMIEIQNVTKQYGSVEVLSDLSFTVPAGETTVLIGPSGCGKSTALRLMIGLIRPTSGQVLFDSEDLVLASGKKLRQLRQRIGYMIQDGGLFPHLTAEENITLMARELKWDPTRIEQRVNELAELTKLKSEWLGRYPVELSGGQRQRVALMRALMLEPDVLLLDEPMGALDPMIRFELQNDLREICRSLGKTVVMVTHDLAEAAYFAHQIILLCDGRIAQKGTLQEMVEQPASDFVSDFINAQRGHSFESTS